ncbi:MAG: sigma-70 family RNA polymerase sigma factor [Owenweeksia sp.]|nr:sigma-70 family RNA polymerase sigma factor [Owenweeksia sp.]
MSSDFYQNSILPFVGIIIKICRAYTDTEDDFQDYYQEVCLQVWKSRNGFKEQSKWSTWVYRIALNVCLSLQRKSRPSQGIEENEVDLRVNNAAFSDEDLNLLYAAIHRLKEVDRAIILLYLEEKSYAEIAQIIGSNPNRVGVKINRIKQQLKKMLDGTIN